LYVLNGYVKYWTMIEVIKLVSRELNSVCRDISLYMQGAGVLTPVIPLIHLMDENSSH
jgi:hypothetical protein